MKGILLAGGQGTRLYPLTRVISKQLLPVYDKPMVFYPLSVLMFAGIREILLISTDHDLPQYQALLGNGHDLGLEISYQVQDKPQGIAQAFLIGEDFIGQDSVGLILGDNIFYGDGLPHLLKTLPLAQGAKVFAYYVQDPSRYGVVEFDKQTPMRIKEKPQTTTSHWAVTGLYFYDNSVIEKAKSLKPSARGELEISDINQLYLEQGQLTVEKLGRGMAWLDTGTHESLLQASQFVETIESRQGLKIACLEEIAFRMGFIQLDTLKMHAEKLSSSQYGAYLQDIIRREGL